MKKQSNWKGINEVVLIVLLLLAIPSLSLGATISGTVRDSIGNPIFGPGNEIGIKMWRGDPCNNHDYVGETVSNSANGTYSVAGLPAGTYYLVTHYVDTNYVNEWWNGDSPDPSNYDCSLAQSITVALGDTVSGTDFWLELGGTIYGTVKDSTGTSITGSGNEIYVNVLAGDPCDYHYHVEKAWINPADGTYRIVVPTGTYYLKTNHFETNFVNEWWNGGSPDPSNDDCSLANSIPATAGNFYPDKDFRLELGAIISGTVRDSTGTPITSEIGVSPITGDACGGFHDYLPGTGTNGNGTYSFVVPAGIYYLRTHNNSLDYVNEWWNGDSSDPSDFDCNLAQFKIVVAGNTYPVNDFQLETGGTITGTVYNNNGSQTLADMNVCADSEGCGGQNFGCTLSDSSGNYAISGILLSATAYLHTEGHAYLKEYYDGGKGSTNCDDALGVGTGSIWIDFY